MPPLSTDLDSAGPTQRDTGTERERAERERSDVHHWSMSSCEAASSVLKLKSIKVTINLSVKSHLYKSDLRREHGDTHV